MAVGALLASCRHDVPIAGICLMVADWRTLVCRDKLQAAESKVRGLVQEKNDALVEKAALERELKQLKGTAGRLTKVRPALSLQI